MTRLKSILKKFNWWNEIISIPVGLAAFYFYPLLAMQLEDNPAVWGVGALQIIVFAFAYFSVCLGLTGITIKVFVPNLFKFKEEEFKHSFDNSTHFQKCLIFLGFFTVILFALLFAGFAL